MKNNQKLFIILCLSAIFTISSCGEHNLNTSNDGSHAAAKVNASLIGKTFIGDNGNYEYTVMEDGTVCLSSYTGSEQHVSIPEKIDKYKVSSIGKEAFRSRNIISVVVPGHVKTIGEEAFADCQNLKTVNLSDGVETVGDSAFSNCEALQELHITDSLIHVGNMAFPHSLEKTQNEINYIGNIAVGFTKNFDGHLVLKQGTVAIGDCAFRSIDWLKNGQNHIFRVEDDTVKIPDTICAIGKNAFLDAYTKNFYIPKSVEYIGDNAFFYENRDGHAGGKVYSFSECKIYGSENSEAERYANSIDVTFVTLK